MTDPRSRPSEISPETRAVDKILDEHSRLRLQYIFLTLGGALVLISIGSSVSLQTESPFWFVGGLVLAAGFYFFLHERAIRKVSDRVMPILADMAGGLEFRPQGLSPSFLQPSRALPHGRVSESEDTVRGRIGEVAFESWEAEIDRKSGKNRRKVFDGFIVRVFVDDQRELLVRPAPSLRSILSIGNFINPDNAPGAKGDLRVLSRDLEVHSSTADWRTSDLKNALEQVARSLPPGLRFRSIRQTGGTAVFVFDSTRDLYTIGGLFSGKDAMRREIHQALKDLAIAPAVAAIWAEVGKKVRTD